MSCCPVCSSENTVIMVGCLDDAPQYDCTFCGRDVSLEIEEQEIQEMLNEADEEYYLDRLSGTEGHAEADQVSSNSGN